MNIDDFNNNILANRWKERYANQPNDIKKKLDTFENSDRTKSLRDGLGSCCTAFSLFKIKKAVEILSDILYC